MKDILDLLTIVDRQTLQHQTSKTRARTTTDSVEDQEALQTGAVIGQLTDAIQAQVDDLFTDGVVTTGEVVGSIFLS